MQLELTTDEATALRELLDRHLGDMSAEISHTDNPAFRVHLRARRDALAAVRAKLGG